jgi:hypothetical protein
MVKKKRKGTQEIIFLSMHSLSDWSTFDHILGFENTARNQVRMSTVAYFDTVIKYDHKMFMTLVPSLQPGEPELEEDPTGSISVRLNVDLSRTGNIFCFRNFEN